MHKIFSKSVLLPDGWHNNVTIQIKDGVINSIKSDTSYSDHQENYQVIMAGMPNLHSHAFQRSMAGFAERRGGGTDSFWSWRNEMYRLALTMTPEQVEHVASQLYMEMLEAGFTRVGEFHYLHNEIDGTRYKDIGEMAASIAAAAEKTSIRLTLLPVFYAHAGFGGQSPVDGQKRFINTTESFAKLLSSCQNHIKSLHGAVLGLAPHSLRAVTPDELKEIVPMANGGPIHIHIAEQLKEVEDCIAWSGQRPVEWLLNHQEIDAKWCFIHATHMTEKETIKFATTKAIAGLCPITEANLGDGVFNAVTFLDNSGCFGIGTDSNVSIDVNDELRQLEYSLRLSNHVRNAIALPYQSNGLQLYNSAVVGGNKALSSIGCLSENMPADFVSLDLNNQSWLKKDNILDNWIFAKNINVESVWVNGRKVVQQGRHILRDTINRKFIETMKTLYN